MLDRFEPLAGSLLRGRDEWDLVLEIGLVTHMFGTVESDTDGSRFVSVPTAAHAFSSETMIRIAQLQCGFDIDEYVDVNNLQ